MPALPSAQSHAVMVIWLAATCTPFSVAETTHDDEAVNVTVLQATLTTGVAGAVTVTNVEALPVTEPAVATTFAPQNPAVKYVQTCVLIGAFVETGGDAGSPQSHK